MRIAKAKIKDGQLHVVLEDSADDTEKKTRLQSLDGFHPDLAAAFAALADPVREILDWPSNQYGDSLFITSVSWSESEATGIEGAVLSGHAVLESKRAFNFNTPFLPYDRLSDNESQPVLPAGAVEALTKLRAEVAAYIEGKRDQGDLFDQQEAA